MANSSQGPKAINMYLDQTMGEGKWAGKFVGIFALMRRKTDLANFFGDWPTSSNSSNKNIEIFLPKRGTLHFCKSCYGFESLQGIIFSDLANNALLHSTLLFRRNTLFLKKVKRP
jgi:hypothetical protein